MSTLKKLTLKIEKENQIFETLTQEQKRVRIAQDCIERVKLQLILPTKGVVCRLKDVQSGTNDLKQVISQGVTCTACAKGSLFLSYVGRVNNFKLRDLQNDNSINDNEHKKLLEIFSIDQLALIEAAFEGKQYLHQVSLRGKVVKFRAFFKKYGGEYEFDDLDYPSSTDEDSNKRLIAICENIIKNKGTFIP